MNKWVSYNKEVETENRIYKITRITIGDGGIGSYEFWGARGYDSYPVVDEIDVEVYDKEHNLLAEVVSDSILDMLYDSIDVYEAYDDHRADQLEHEYEIRIER